jgi:TolB-like protein/DNA-binding winged helix-turn-helix (wHTH) protein/Tfp pilus assembly protein PilF
MNTASARAPNSAVRIYRVGDLRVDVGQQRVTREGAEVPLPKLSFELLLALIRTAPDIISNDELMALVWPGLVVSPETVSQRIKLLRDALSDDPRIPRYIAGLRGRGYRLIGPVADATFEHTDGSVQSDSGSAMQQSLSPARTASETKTEPKPATIGPRRPVRLRAWIFPALAGLGVTVLLVAGILSQRRPAVAPSSVLPTSVTVEGLPPRSVAVLPFANMSVEKSNDYIGLGLAEMVLNRLSEVPELLVIARTSSFTFRDKNVDAREIAHKLNARYLIEGSVQRVGPRLRVGAQLIDAQTGRQFKAMRFDRDFADIFKVQDEIAEQVAAALEVGLGGLDTHQPDPARNVKFDAYLAYLQGRALLNHWRVSDSAAAIERFSRAIAIDPSFAAAYVGLAQAHYQTTNLEEKIDPEMLPEPAELVDKALALDDTLGEAYIMRAQLKIGRDRAGAEADFRKGLALSPSYGAGYAIFADALSDWNRPQEALQMIDRAIVIDPLVPRHPYLKAVYVFGEAMDRYPIDAAGLNEAKALMLRVLEIDPNFSPALVRLAAWRWEGDSETAEAIKLIEQALRFDPDRPWIRLQLSQMYLDVGDLIAAEDVISESKGTAPSGLIASAVYRGDWRTADELAYAKPKAQLYDWSSLFAIVAIQDYALKTGKLDRAIKYLYQAYELHIGHEMDGPLGDALGLTLVLLLQKKGDKAAAHTLMNEITQLCAHHPDYFYMCAVGHLLAGEREAALDSARKASEQPGGLPQYWWYLFDRDPILADIRSDPRFQAIVSSQRDLAARQRTLLEQMRAKGEVPARDSVPVREATSR